MRRDGGEIGLYCLARRVTGGYRNSRELEKNVRLSCSCLAFRPGTLGSLCHEIARHALCLSLGAWMSSAQFQPSALVRPPEVFHAGPAFRAAPPATELVLRYCRLDRQG
jgi:hypothetical protein